MSDSEDKPAIPSWQRDANTADSQIDETSSDTASSSSSSSPPPPPPSSTPTTEDQLDVARRFLQDDAVRNESREKKVAFLKEKGMSDSDIESLLAEPTPDLEVPTPRYQLPSSTDSLAKLTATIQSSTSSSTSSASTTPSFPSSSSSSSSSPSTALTIPSDRPPIVTYPEFLTQPAAPPPLVTTTALLTTLSSFLGLATLVHGTSRYLLQPMHESLSEARIDLHATTSERLDALVSRLEEAVSEVPPHAPGKRATAFADDEDSEAGDPTEMFHRDVGTQTTGIEDLPPMSSAKSPTPSQSEVQATRLQDLVSSLRPLNESFRTQSTDFEDIGTLIDVFRDDLAAMTGMKASAPFYSGSFANFKPSLTSSKEPDDEIKKARDALRRFKGAMLSTRNFPSTSSA